MFFEDFEEEKKLDGNHHANRMTRVPDRHPSRPRRLPPSSVVCVSQEDHRLPRSNILPRHNQEENDEEFEGNHEFQFSELLKDDPLHLL